MTPCAPTTDLLVLCSDMSPLAQQQQHNSALRVEDGIVQRGVPLVVLCLQIEASVQQPRHLCNSFPFFPRTKLQLAVCAKLLKHLSTSPAEVTCSQSPLMSDSTGTSMRQLLKDWDVFGRPDLVRIAEHGSPVQSCLSIVVHGFDIDAKL